jgi:hypothetical protein
MKNRKYIVAISIATMTAPILFFFQNCSKKGVAFSKIDVAATTIPKNALCTDVSQVDGDMRTEIISGKNKAEVSTLEFGTFEDNYWSGDSKNNGQTSFGNLYERRMSFELGETENISEFILTDLSFDDWLSVTVNDHVVYVGPYSGDRLEFNFNTGAVQYGANKYSSAELSTSWVKTESIDVLKFLKAGVNIVKTKTIVAGYGESAIRFQYKMNCK